MSSQTNLFKYSVTKENTVVNWDEIKKITDTALSNPQVASNLTKILIKHVGGFNDFYRSSKAEDIKGVDIWVRKINGTRLGIDLKFMRQDYKDQKFFSSDNLPLETLSKINPEIVGWTLDDRKITDVVLWYWLPTERYCLVPYKPLRKIFTEKLTEWDKEFKKNDQTTPTSETVKKGWDSQCMFVPRLTVFSALGLDAELYCGMADQL